MNSAPQFMRLIWWLRLSPLSDLRQTWDMLSNFLVPKTDFMKLCQWRSAGHDPNNLVGREAHSLQFFQWLINNLLFVSHWVYQYCSCTCIYLSGVAFSWTSILHAWNMMLLFQWHTEGAMNTLTVFQCSTVPDVFLLEQRWEELFSSSLLAVVSPQANFVQYGSVFVCKCSGKNMSEIMFENFSLKKAVCTIFLQNAKQLSKPDIESSSKLSKLSSIKITY